MPFADGVPLIAATRVADVPRSRYIPSDVLPGQCINCGAAVYLAPRSREWIAAGQAQAACTPCAIEVATHGSFFFAGCLPGQEEQEQKWLREQAERN